MDESKIQSRILDDPELKDLNDSDIIRPLPKNDNPNFSWRLRVDCRSGMNLKLNRVRDKGLPSCFIEVGFSESEGKRPEDKYLEVTKTIK
jgi:hypothetical protein